MRGERAVLPLKDIRDRGTKRSVSGFAIEHGDAQRHTEIGSSSRKRGMVDDQQERSAVVADRPAKRRDIDRSASSVSARIARRG